MVITCHQQNFREHPCISLLCRTTMWGPQTIAKLVYNYNWYLYYNIPGATQLITSTGAPHCIAHHGHWPSHGTMATFPQHPHSPAMLPMGARTVPSIPPGGVLDESLIPTANIEAGHGMVMRFYRVSHSFTMKNHRRTIGILWFNGVFDGIYLLVMSK